MKKTKIVIFSALLIGLLYAAPQFLIWRSINESGQEFILNQLVEINDEGYFYLQNAREVYDGHFPPKDFFFDSKEQKITPLNALPPAIFSGFIFLTGDVNTAYILADLILPIVLFLLFYTLGQIIFNRNKPWSLLFSFTALLTPIVLIVPRAFFSLENFGNIVLKNFYPSIKTLLPRLFYSRIDYPLVTDLIYLPAIIFFLIFWNGPKLKTAIPAGIFGGLLFYTYFHYWVYWSIVLGILFLYTLIFLKEDKIRLKFFLILIGVITLISVPYWINYFNFASSDFGNEFTLRISIEIGRHFKAIAIPHFIAYFILSGLVLFAFKKKDRAKTVLFLVFLLAAFFVWNIQFILGYVPHSDHWERAISPLIFIIIFSLLYYLSEEMLLHKTYFKKITAGFLMLLVALLIVKKCVNTMNFVNLPPQELQTFTLPKNITDSFQWIEKNIEGEPKMISNSFWTSIRLPALTSARPFLAWGLAGTLENQENHYLISNKLFNISPDELEKRLRNNQDNVLHNLYTLYFQTQGIKQVPESKIQDLINRYKELDVKWSEVNANYVYNGPFEKQIKKVNFGLDPNLKLIYSNPSVEIYKIK